MPELLRECIARNIADDAVTSASVCSGHPEILINALHFPNSIFAQVFVRKVLERSAAVIKTTVLALVRETVQFALLTYFFEGAHG